MDWADRPTWSELRKATRLCGWRVRSCGAWKAAKVLSIATAVVFTAFAVYLAAKGHGPDLSGVTARAAILVGWIVGGILGLWSASDRAGADETDGFGVLALCHGLSSRCLATARALSATAAVAVLVFAVTVPVCVPAIVKAPSVAAAFVRACSLIVLAVYACGVGLISGGLGSICAGISPRRGRTLWLVVVLLPWILDGWFAAGRVHGASLPGVLGTLASWMQNLGAMG